MKFLLLIHKIKVKTCQFLSPVVLNFKICKQKNLKNLITQTLQENRRLKFRQILLKPQLTNFSLGPNILNQGISPLFSELILRKILITADYPWCYIFFFQKEKLKYEHIH